MAERDYMIIGLVKEVLGPREGPNEVLSSERDPRNEYITGVLAPELPERDAENDIDADSDELAIEDSSDDEDQGAEGVIIAPPSAFSPALDPKSQPRSIGVSFVIFAVNGHPSLDICTTWARYLLTDQGSWQRHPRGTMLSAQSVDAAFDQSVGDDVGLSLRSHLQDDGSYRVSLYLVNRRGIAKGKKPTTSDFVFQPQIRVHCAHGNLRSVDVVPSQALHDPLSVEDVELAMLYRNRMALARGHLCGAMWKDIDPERPHATLSSLQDAPFAWTDRSLFSGVDQAKFSPPDARTELVPCYPVEAPSVQWAWSGGTLPELQPLILAETWKPDDIRLRLNPLVEGYEQWIAVQYQLIATLPQYWHSFAQSNLAKCEQVAKRMREGIDRLVSDEQVRLAFCFANQAIAVQSQWTSIVARPWRPFQLAFLLLNISALADPTHPDRTICDLLWFPTGGGKTEAYLGLAAFTLGLRRLRARKQKQGDCTGAGVAVLSRYTLRLLTIQQFRRALGVITACEVLRVMNLGHSTLPAGWRPKDFPYTSQLLWGGVRFSIGMWVGGNVTPNNLIEIEYMQPSGKLRHIAGALEILQGLSAKSYEGLDPDLRKTFQTKNVDAEGDPAQVLTCPACRAWLAIPPQDGLPPKQYTLHFVLTGNVSAPLSASILNQPPRIQVDSMRVVTHTAPDTQTLSVTFTVVDGNVKAEDIDQWWYDLIRSAIPAKTIPRLLAARPSRPGYFLSTYTNIQSSSHPNTFEIYCPNPDCLLNHAPWAEQVPLNLNATGTSASAQQASLFGASTGLPSVPGVVWQDIPPFVQGSTGHLAERIPIPAYTVDDQIYHRCPSLVIATVDKFARLAFEPKAAALFGNVSHYHARWGYYRQYAPPRSDKRQREDLQEHPPALSKKQTLRVDVSPLSPPELIIQDELHLLEGPLGSMVGLYETAIDTLCERRIGSTVVRPKYVASTATVRQADSQVQSLFARSLAQFPPSALDADKRFFAETRETHPLESARAGRLYVAITGPGKGAQTPIVRIWSALLQTAYERRQAGAGSDLDGYWTLAGYFNAIRELAGAAALYRQDILERMKTWPSPRLLKDYALELSSRANSLALPGLLEQLAVPWGEDVVLATSMFGTGVDVDRLGLMVVHGQPKTTSAYIQATGRVGRQQGGLVVTFFRVSRPRDLDHYEFFTGYHRMLYRAVEPITVTPFAPRARDRGLGPLAVALLRQAQELGGNPVQQPWHIEQRIGRAFISRAYLMATSRRNAEVQFLASIFEQRAAQQPAGRRPSRGAVANEMDAELDRWEAIAYDQIRLGGSQTDRIVYNESSMNREPERAVVLGDAQHQLMQLPVAFENAPQSLRDVEATTQFKE